MAFVSIKRDLPPGLKSLPPFVVFRKPGSGKCTGNLNKALPLRGKTIDVQIDSERKILRLAECETGFVVYKFGGFTCPAETVAEVGEGRIWLTLADDGWWYGSYAEAGQEK